jgi:sugar/nucleoside kinase (ribokinase family)
VDKIIDTTGCGDAYQAAFCCKWFETGNIHNALLAGSEAGREVLSVVGGSF